LNLSAKTRKRFTKIKLVKPLKMIRTEDPTKAGARLAKRSRQGSRGYGGLGRRSQRVEEVDFDKNFDQKHVFKRYPADIVFRPKASLKNILGQAVHVVISGVNRPTEVQKEDVILLVDYLYWISGHLRKASQEARSHRRIVEKLFSNSALMGKVEAVVFYKATDDVNTIRRQLAQFEKRLNRSLVVAILDPLKTSVGVPLKTSSLK